MRKAVSFFTTPLVSVCSGICAAVKRTVLRVGKAFRDMVHRTATEERASSTTAEGGARRAGTGWRSLNRVQEPGAHRNPAVETPENFLMQVRPCTVTLGRTSEFSLAMLSTGFVGEGKDHTSGLDCFREPAVPAPVGLAPETQAVYYGGFFYNGSGTCLGSRALMEGVPEGVGWRSGLGRPPILGDPARLFLCMKSGTGGYRREWPRGSPCVAGGAPPEK